MPTQQLNLGHSAEAIFRLTKNSRCFEKFVGATNPSQPAIGMQFNC